MLLVVESVVEAMVDDGSWILSCENVGDGRPGAFMCAELNEGRRCGKGRETVELGWTGSRT